MSFPGARVHKSLIGNLARHSFSLFDQNKAQPQTAGRVLPYERLIGMCRLMGSHFHDWIDYNGVAFSIEFTRMGSHIN